MVRRWLFLTQKLYKHKLDYPNLYQAFEEAKKKSKRENISLKYSSTWVSDELYKQEYIPFIKKHFEIKLPIDDREVWVTTHNGGKHVGFYKNGKWQYRAGSEDIVEETAIVIRVQSGGAKWTD